MKNTFPQDYKKQTAKIVLIGTSLQGIDLLCQWQSKFTEMNVVLFEKSALAPFLLEALLMAKGKHPLFTSDKCSAIQVENITFNFDNSTIKLIDKEARTIIHTAGVFRYDCLLLEEEKPLKIFFKKDFYFGALLRESYQLNYEIDRNELVLIEGKDLFAIAIAMKLLNCGLVPIILCTEPRFAFEEIPEEEACLIGKYLKNLGIESIFDDHLLFNSMIINKDFLEIKSSKGKTFHVHSIISASIDSFKFNDMEGIHEELNKRGINLELLGSYISNPLGVNLSQQLLYGINSNGETKNDASQLTFSFFFGELEWKRYGEISPDCGKSTHNFYWEHPGGEVSFRMQYEKSDLLIKGLSFLGLPFKIGFIEAILHAKWNAHEFIRRMNEGLVSSQQKIEVLPLIKKSFEVEFKNEIKKVRAPFYMRILKKLKS